MKHAAVLLLFLVPVCAQEHPLETLIDAAHQQSPALKELLPANIHALRERGGAAVWGPDFLFAIEIETTPAISVDRQAPLSLSRVPGSNLWYRLMRLRAGVTHSYEFFSDGKPMSLMYSYDVAGYNLDSYPRASVPRGTIREKKTMVSGGSGEKQAGVSRPDGKSRLLVSRKRFDRQVRQSATS